MRAKLSEGQFTTYTVHETIKKPPPTDYVEKM